MKEAKNLFIVSSAQAKVIKIILKCLLDIATTNPLKCLLDIATTNPLKCLLDIASLLFNQHAQ